MTEESSRYLLISLDSSPTLAEKKARPSSQMNMKVLFPCNTNK